MVMTSFHTPPWKNEVKKKVLPKKFSGLIVNFFKKDGLDFSPFGFYILYVISSFYCIYKKDHIISIYVQKLQ